MRIVALEEHCTFPDIAARICPDAIRARGLTPGGHPVPAVDRRDQLRDVGAGRLDDMDAAGITLQVLSVAQAGADLLPGEEGGNLARDINDRLALTVAEHPDRYAAFAHLPTSAPELAADELERCVEEHGFLGGMVNGTTGGLFLDDPKFESLLARFERLGAPLYIHPAPPPPAVREIYYDRLPGNSSLLLSIAGWGWHSETAIHVLRLVLSGALDRHPKLKLIIGHMGEGLPAMFARCDQVFADEARDRLTRTVSQTMTDQVWVTTSGFFSLPPLTALLMTFGADRVLFSVDYPFSPNAKGTDFLRSLPIPEADKIKLAHGNADRLLGLEASRHAIAR
jgi:predicted TIM-barrel fold metal-dependent hydrolase